MDSSPFFCPRLTDLNNERKRQIDTLKIFNDKLVFLLIHVYQLTITIVHT